MLCKNDIKAVNVTLAAATVAITFKQITDIFFRFNNGNLALYLSLFLSLSDNHMPPHNLCRSLLPDLSTLSALLFSLSYAQA